MPIFMLQVQFMFADHHHHDELFVGRALYIVFASCFYQFAFSFQSPNQPQDLQVWLDLLFLSFSLQSATGLSDLMPISPAARVLTTCYKCFCG